MSKTMAIVIRENKQLRRRRVPDFGEWLFDQKNYHAWFTLRRLYTYIGKSIGLVLDERYAIPVSPWAKKRYTEEDIEEKTDQETRVRQAHHAQKNAAARSGQINVVAWTISLISTGLVFVFIVLAILIASGKISV